MPVRKAVIPAAGFGTRFLPATKAQPKEMLPIVDTPIIQYVVEEAIASGIEDILIITGRGKRTIEDHFDRSIELETFLERNHRDSLLSTVRDVGNLANVFFVRQKEQLGLGHAVLQARHHIGNEPFAVLLGDEIFFGARPALSQLMDVYDQVGGSVVGVMEVSADEVQRYGVIKPEKVNEGLYLATDLVEKPATHEAPSRMAICGRYVLDPAIFDILETLPPGKNGEIQLTDAIRILGKWQPIYACEIDARRYDVGDKLGYLQATVEIALEREDLGEAFRDYLTNLLLTRSEVSR
ncbi:UTP--glucose-1-phosphate uridylyltransferase GalU [Symbiobacterium thermophilum]|uniref:UTP--glucose-1-phosphate uridylyltransferase n=1 Tax=Symbiobacterium thermophilum TaxID=2734 RepID=A0A953IB97_SYMTR|nr:UTP--glucose-1-phosphate uridylyltransferase GalU [Symbiobacterium thermophilum]MBY6277858.1 UTP--glucose-1-phosphate uridylyltransferase [Symbiobacterium thermophilum]